VEGDPRPGAFKGRMSFQSFNPTVDVSLKIQNLKACFLYTPSQFIPCASYFDHIRNSNAVALPL